ncbi:Y-family DNA polymerase [Salinicoccus jeotgali]|uniref:Y-family DNA polymerase n=1 Tax=Salinicoccus jeotgali TaxID=381634 RepID=A0ABP7EXB9_9STAP
MYNYHICPKRHIFCVDQKSFFASVSCILKGLDPLTTRLAVVADTKNPGAVVLAATPALKRMGIKTGSRLFEIPNRKDIYIINPSMKTYLDYSSRITEIALKYVAPEDFHQYSVDEYFMDVTKSFRLFEESPWGLALRLRKEIYQETRIDCAIGIGENPLLSKLSLDIEAKRAPFGIAEWRYEDVPEKMWHIKPLRTLWGINKNSEARLNERGIFSVGDLARYPPEYLKRDFGIIGVDWHLHANGIDFSTISEKHSVHAPSIAKSQILMRDYHLDEVYVVMLEHIDEVTHRLRLSKRLARTIHFSVGTADGKVYRKQFTLDGGTSDGNIIMEGVWDHIIKMADAYAMYRTLSISLTNLIPDDVRQLSLFEDPGELKREDLLRTIDALKVRFGQLSVMRALSCTEASTLKLREGLIAGHKR